MVLEALRLVSDCTVTLGMAVEGTWGAWKTRICCIPYGIARLTIVWAQPGPDQDQEEMCPASPPQCLFFLGGWRSCRQEGNGASLAPAGARGEPGPCTDPESSPQHGREQGSRSCIHLAPNGSPEQPCHFIPLC